MAESFSSYKIENDTKFRAALERAKGVTDDLRVPLTLITKDFYRSNKAIFMLKSAGQYPDLGGFSPDTPVSLRGRQVTRRVAAQFRKKQMWGFVYPILKGSGRLEGSVTDPTHADAVNQIINKRTLIIGTTVPYGVYHQSDRQRSKIPLRKFLFIGPESKFANSDQQGRVGRWMNILNAYVLQKLKQKGS